MTLFAGTRDVAGWILQVLRRFIHVSRRTTWAVIACLTAGRITRMLAFLLPLKVILLAGTDGVPRYFRFFISPEHRDAWVIGLSAAAIVAYALTLFLEARSKRLSEQGSADLLAASGVMSVVANQHDQAQGFYERFTQIASATLFAAIALLALSLLNPVLALYVAGLVSCFYLLTVWALRGATALRRTRLSDFVTLRLGAYLGVLSAVAFLSSFLVILYPFVAGAGGNILVAIICVVLLRQVLSSLRGSIKDAVALAEKRPLIDTLVFPDRRLQLAENKGHRTLRELFGRREREARIARELAGLARPGQSFRVEWRDPLVRGMAEFAVALEGGEAPARHFRLRVFPPRFGHMVENEDLLFSHVEREAVWAPPLVGRFSHGEHECLIWEAGTGMPATAEEWRDLPARFLADLWSVEPPPALVKIYSSSHSFLHQRLTDEFVARMDIAIDNDREEEAFARFCGALGALRRHLAALPLCLVSPGLASAQFLARPDGGFYLPGWGQWALEPAGAGLQNLLGDEPQLEGLIDEAARRRPAIRTASPTAKHLEMARQSALLEQAVLRARMKAGLALAEQVTAAIEAVAAETS